MKRRFALLALALSVGAASCNADRVTASNDLFALEASISDATIAPSETATVSYRLRNVSRLPVTVSVGCGMLPYIKDDGGAIVYPGGGIWFCALILLPPVTLAPGEEITRSFHVNGGPAPASRGSGLSLPPGRYTVYVEFLGALPDVRKKVQLRTSDVPFEVTG
jgi:hypothetical protein